MFSRYQPQLDWQWVNFQLPTDGEVGGGAKPNVSRFREAPSKKTSIWPNIHMSKPIHPLKWWENVLSCHSGRWPSKPIHQNAHVSDAWGWAFSRGMGEPENWHPEHSAWPFSSIPQFFKQTFSLLEGQALCTIICVLFADMLQKKLNKNSRFSFISELFLYLLVGGVQWQAIHIHGVQ